MFMPRNDARRLRWELEQSRHLLLQRIEKLEAGARQPAPPAHPLLRLVSWMGPALPALIGSVVVLMLGYWIKDSVDQALSRQQLQLSYVKEMQPLLEKLGHSGEGELGATGKEQIAVLLAGFGEPAVMPLAHELRYAGSRLQSAETGLRALAMSNPDAICRRLPAVLGSAPPLLGWQGQQAVAGVLASAGCVQAAPLLRQQALAIKRGLGGDASALQAIANDQPDIANLRDWQRTVDEALASLRAAQARGARQ